MTTRFSKADETVPDYRLWIRETVINFTESTERTTVSAGNGNCRFCKSSLKRGKAVLAVLPCTVARLTVLLPERYPGTYRARVPRDGI